MPSIFRKIDVYCAWCDERFCFLDGSLTNKELIQVLKDEGIIVKFVKGLRRRIYAFCSEKCYKEWEDDMIEMGYKVLDDREGKS